MHAGSHHRLTRSILCSEQVKPCAPDKACTSCTALQVRQEQAGLLSQPQEKREMIRYQGRLMPYDDYVRDHLRRPYDEPAESRDARRAAIFEAVEQQGWTVRWAAAWLCSLGMLCSGLWWRGCCQEWWAWTRRREGLRLPCCVLTACIRTATLNAVKAERWAACGCPCALMAPFCCLAGLRNRGTEWDSRQMSLVCLPLAAA